MHLGSLPPGKDKASPAHAALAALTLAALAPHPAAAQQRDNALMRSEILDQATLRNDADMDFGLIIPSGNNGTVVMTPSASPTCTTTGGLVHTGACKAAVFGGTGTNQSELRVQRPTGDRIDLVGPGGARMRLQDFTFGAAGSTIDLTPNGANPHRFRIGALDGAFLFYVGGTLNVGATQTPGVYNGTYQIRITYN